MERLSFLYLITGNMDKLRKMLKIAEMQVDIMSRFHNSLYLGEVPERVRLLQDAGQLPLAYVTALTHNLPELAESIATQLQAADRSIPHGIACNARMLYPRLPILRECNWPLLTVSKGTFERGLTEGAADSGLHADLDDVGDGGGWGDDLDLNLGNSGDADSSMQLQSTADDVVQDPDLGAVGGWGDDLELDLGDVTLASSASGLAGSGYYVAPSTGTAIASIWSRDSQLAADQVAAGSFESAMHSLRRQLGVIDFTPLKPLFLSLGSSSHAVLNGTLATPSLLSPLFRVSNVMPRLCLSLSSLVDRLKSGYQLVTNGKFQEALDAFLQIISSIALVVVNNRQQVNELKELLSICREYITALKLELLRKKTTDPARQMELAAYFTHCNLQSSHTMLSLRSAMTAAYKLKLLKSASSFARRLLELNPRPEISTQARKVIQLGETNPVDAFEYRYDERNPFVVCNLTLLPIYRGSALARCSFCKAAFQPEFKTKVCSICSMGEIGGQAPGLEESFVLDA
mmetsp:Transcript_35920/g.99297  ORF Transcript_35920/g.99297 Transcript_35920/m.99297 type:complete len:517 (+) Transcript_35920:2282-3832(+)